MNTERRELIETIENYPGYEGYNKVQVWIYKLDKDFEIKSNIVGHCFKSKRLTVSEDGTIKIGKGYAWNGCSPKFQIFDIGVIGTPDGTVDKKTFKTKTYYASLVHDALYQYYAWHDIEREEIDRYFLKMMTESKFSLAKLYYRFVRCLGWFAVSKKKEEVGFIRFKPLCQSPV